MIRSWCLWTKRRKDYSNRYDVWSNAMNMTLVHNFTKKIQFHILIGLLLGQDVHHKYKMYLCFTVCWTNIFHYLLSAEQLLTHFQNNRIHIRTAGMKIWNIYSNTVISLQHWATCKRSHAFLVHRSKWIDESIWNTALVLLSPPSQFSNNTMTQTKS